MTLALLEDALMRGGVRVDSGPHHLIAQCDHATLAATMREAGVVADALIVDAPYSERTHAGHDDGIASANRSRAWTPSNEARRARASKAELLGIIVRRVIDYGAWSAADVAAFVGAWSPVVRGWVGSLTDHHLAPAWESALGAADRYTFSPLACIESGSRVRLGGDGPSQWATWLVVARPRSREWQSWGTLPGAYVGGSERKAVTGGKPLWLMRAIVGDYSREGDLVVDPCMGAGTTLVAAVELGRIALGCEPDAGRFERARKRLASARPQLRMRLDVDASAPRQMEIGGDGE